MQWRYSLSFVRSLELKLLCTDMNDVTDEFRVLGFGKSYAEYLDRSREYKGLGFGKAQAEILPCRKVICGMWKRIQRSRSEMRDPCRLISPIVRASKGAS